MQCHAGACYLAFYPQVQGRYAGNVPGLEENVAPVHTAQMGAKGQHVRMGRYVE
jgi:hypothetical protein